MRKTYTYPGKQWFYLNILMPYYFSKRKLDKKIKQLQKDFNISDIKSLKHVSHIKKQDPKFWKIVTGDFGEACLAWMMEENILKGDIFLASVLFADSPLRGAEGVDLVGIEISKRRVCYGESKFRNSTSKKEIERTIKKLTDQLSDSRLGKIFNGDHDGFSYYTFQSLQWLKNELENLMEENKLPFDEKILKLLEKRNYSRYGSIIRPKSNLDIADLFNKAFEEIDKNCKEYNGCIKKCEPICKERNPISLIDFQLESLLLEIESFLRSIGGEN